MNASIGRPDFIFYNAQFTNLNGPAHGKRRCYHRRSFSAVGDSAEVLGFAGVGTRIVDLKGRSALPGLIDNHLHLIRGSLNFSMELRWDGVRSLTDAVAMLKRQVDVTPAPQWVRVMGGFTEHQFVEKRLPKLDEINARARHAGVSAASI